MRRLLLILLLAIPLLPSLVARAQEGPVLNARRRLFPEVGPGLRAIRRGPDGHYYVLVAPAGVVTVFDSAGKKVGQVPAQPVGAAAIVFGEAMDMDASGRLFVADRGANAVNIYTADGSLLAHVRICAPTAIAALPHDEIAVSCLNADHLISVYDFKGTLLREFGDLADLALDPALNHRLNLGSLVSDNAGNLYFAFKYLPEPTVRKYDRFGYLAEEFVVNSQESQSTALAAEKELARANKNGAVISPHDIISGLGVDVTTQDLWIALGALLVHFDRNAAVLGSNRAYTVDGAPLAPSFILTEPDRLLLGSDPLGIYDVPRPAGNKPTL